MHSRAAETCFTASRITFCAFLALRVKIGDDFAERHRGVRRMPAIVICNHRHRGVTKLRLTRELCFCEIRHADHVEAQLPVGMRFGQRRKLRAFHANVSAATMHFHFARSQASPSAPDSCEQVGLSNPTCATTPPPKNVATRKPRAIVELIGNQEIERRKFLAQRSDRAHRNHSLERRASSSRRYSRGN